MEILIKSSICLTPMIFTMLKGTDDRLHFCINLNDCLLDLGRYNCHELNNLL